MAEGRMNLAALQQRDPYISDIVDNASQVALYKFNSKANEWEKTSIEGSLFVYKRSASPVNGFMILNRLGLNNLIEPITRDLEYQQQDPFLLYRNAKSIYGIWFYDKDECCRIGQLMNSLLQLVIEQHAAKGSPRPRRASDGEGLDMKSSQVDILQMLSRAQHDYEKTNAPPGSTGKKTEPKPMIDNPNAAATKTNNLIRPTPLKMPDTEEGGGEEDSVFVGKDVNQNATTPTAAISLETLFRSASLSQQSSHGTAYPSANMPSVPKSTLLHRSVSLSVAEGRHSVAQPPPMEPPSGGGTGGDIPSLLRHIMSSGSMVEDIERQQIGGQSKDGGPPSREGMGKISPTPHKDSVSSISLDNQPKFYGGNDLPSHPSIINSVSSPNQKKPVIGGYVRTSEQPHKSHDQISPIIASGSDHTGLPKKSPPAGSTGKGPNTGSLLTPADLMQAPPTPSAGQTEKPVPVNPSLAAAASSLAPDVLLSPMAFVTSSRRTPPAAASALAGPMDKSPVDKGEKSKEEFTLPVAALTKEQLQQALMYLLKNDPSFISTLHEAYLKSLQELSGYKS